MALSANDAAELQRKLQEIERLSRQLGVNINTLNLRPLEENAGAIEAIFERLNQQAQDLGGETEYLVSNFQKLVGELRKSTEGVNQASRSFKSLSSISEQILGFQKGYNSLSSKEIAKLKDKVKAETDRLKIARDVIDNETQELTLQRNSITFLALNAREQQTILDRLNKNRLTREKINDLLESEDATLSELNNRLKEAEVNVKRIEKALGATGTILKGISKIPILGDLVDTQEALKAAEEAAQNGAGKLGTMKAAIGSLGKSLLSNLKDPLVLIGLIGKGFQKLIEIGFRVDQEVTDISKSMAVSKDQATAVRDRFVQIQNSGESLFETTKNLVAAQLELAGAFGATQGFTEQQVRDQVYLTKQIGLSVDEAAGLQQLAMANGMTAKEVTGSVIKQTASLARQTGIQLDNKKILGEVAKVSGQIRLQYQNNPELIAKAVVQTQKLGITLEQAAKQAQHLLNFEESISDQIAAELLTGKELNLERARLLSLNGDIAGASADILEQVGSAAEFSSMNVIQQEALAKAVGLTANELADSLIQQENLNRLGSETKKQIQEQAEELRKKGMVDEANRLMASIGNETEAQAALDRISAQETFNAAVEKLQAMLVSIVEGPAMKLVNLIVRLVSDTSKLKVILATMVGLVTAMAVAWAVMNPTAAIAGLAAGVGIGALVYSQIKDGEVNNQGLIVGKYNKGQIQPIAQGAPEDNVIFTTNKISNKTPVSPSNNDSTAMLVREQQKSNELLSKLLHKEGKVQYDSNLAGKSANINTYSIA